MKLKLLLPNKFKRVGWVLLTPSMIAGMYLLITGFEGRFLKAPVFAIAYDEILENDRFFKIVETDISNTAIGVFFIIGALLVGFSKEKNEDEFIAEMRLNALLWAVLLNYSLLLFAFVFIYGSFFLNIDF